MSSGLSAEASLKIMSTMAWPNSACLQNEAVAHSFLIYMKLLATACITSVKDRLVQLASNKKNGNGIKGTDWGKCQRTPPICCGIKGHPLQVRLNNGLVTFHSFPGPMDLWIWKTHEGEAQVVSILCK